MKKYIKRIIPIVMLVLTTATVQGEFVQRNTTPNVWTDWNVNGWFSQSSVVRLPTSNDWVRMHYNRDTYLTDAQAAAKLDMYWIGGADLRIDNGGSLNVTTANGYDGTITLSGAGSTAGIPNVGNISIESGGTLTSGNTGARIVLNGNVSQKGSLNLNGGTFIAQGSSVNEALQVKNSIINLNSGTFDMTGGQIWMQDVEMNINGDQTAIDFSYLNLASTLSADFNFNMDSAGISTINVGSWVHLLNANIVVDGSAYTGGAGDFVLFSSPNLASTPLNAAVAQNFGALDVSFKQIGNDYVMSVIPEPGTLGMVGLAAFGVFITRRFRM